MDNQVKDKKDFSKRTKTRISPQQLLELGKQAPSAVEIEAVVLGALMLDQQALMNTIDILRPEMFYKEGHASIFKAIESLFQKAEAVDILTVVAELKRTGELEMAGRAFYVTQLTNRIASASNIQFHARIIIEKYIQREIIRISTDTLQHAYEDDADVFELLSHAEENIFSISNTTIKKTFEHIKSILGRSLNEIESAKNQKFNGVPSGFTSLDRITGGWHKSDLVILAARPGSGKTSFAVTVARNAAVIYDKPIAIFSLEMTSTQLVNRLIASEAEIGSDKLSRGEINDSQWQQIHKNIGRLAESPIYIDDTPGLSIFEFHAKAKRLKTQYDVSMIIVDYLQLMTTGSSNNKFTNEQQEVALISKTLKNIAKELDIPIIALSQMSRAVEQRTDKKPQLSDLRGSGAIEQDADIVMFIHRPSICGIMQDENGMSTEGMAEIIIAKHRNGKIDSVTLSFIEHFAKFTDPISSASSFTSNPSPTPTPVYAEQEEASDTSSIHKITPNKDFLSQGPRNFVDTDKDFDEGVGF